MELIVTMLLFAWLCYVASRYKGWLALAGHLTLTLLISFVENDWIEREMNRPGWNGIPDRDIVFFMGLSTHITVANIALLPVSAAGLWQRYAKALTEPGADNNDSRSL